MTTASKLVVIPATCTPGFPTKLVAVYEIVFASFDMITFPDCFLTCPYLYSSLCLVLDESTLIGSDSERTYSGHGACDATRFMFLCSWDALLIFLNASVQRLGLEPVTVASQGIFWDKLWINPSRVAGEGPRSYAERAARQGATLSRYYDMNVHQCWMSSRREHGECMETWFAHVCTWYACNRS